MTLHRRFHPSTPLNRIVPLFLCLMIPWHPGAAESFSLMLRQRIPSAAQANEYEFKFVRESWKPKETAIIVCDMWDLHHCKNAVLRGKEMAPRMNRVLEAARDSGAFIIHAPSSCMAAYEGYPGRRLAQAAPLASNLPEGISEWCNQIPAEERGQYPIDQSDGGEDDDPVEHQQWADHLAAIGRNPEAPWKSETDLLTIHDQDAISDSGVEIWNLLEQRRIKNVILLGVHVNMCVLGRPFGLRQLAKNGKHVVLMRDMTDSMYNPKSWPYVDHYRGTELIIEHIEKFVCPTLTSDQILGGKPFEFQRRPAPDGARSGSGRLKTRAAAPLTRREHLVIRTS
jgi:nicotinamidase-related amidase